MTIDRRRRRLLVSTATWAGVSALAPWSRLVAAAELSTESQPFSFETLIERARTLAAQPYQAPGQRYTDLLDNLGYETFMGIHARKSEALWHGESDQPFSVEFFPLDQNARTPVAIHVVENGQARRIRYSPSLFRYDDDAIADELPEDLGFAGFRVLDKRDDSEVLAFKGASYFRSPGELDQYGLSARGVAVDTGFGGDEQFPRFSRYWLIKPAPGEREFTLCALLEGERITGAYRMRCRRDGAMIMDVESHLFQRAAIQRLGIAPLTSMFWFSETNARRGIDWRPEIHDSDGLALSLGNGEHLWRALDNPPHAQYSAFLDDNPRGFGLLQRDREFDHYQDADVRFERRPSLWVQPKGDWGAGHVGLLELPTDEEVFDNINVFWVPQREAAAGSRWRFDYRLFWCATPPDVPVRARVVATRTGRAGDPGSYDDQSVLARKFVIDFEGDMLDVLADDAEVEVRAHANHGRIVNPYAVRVAGTPRWRAFFDWTGELPPDDEPVELLCMMAHAERVITETWAFAYFPQPLPRRLSDDDA